MAADGGGKMFRCLCADVKFVLLKLWTRLSEVPCCLTSVFQYGIGPRFAGFGALMTSGK